MVVAAVSEERRGEARILVVAVYRGLGSEADKSRVNDVFRGDDNKVTVLANVAGDVEYRRRKNVGGIFVRRLAVICPAVRFVPFGDDADAVYGVVHEKVAVDVFV